MIFDRESLFGYIFKFQALIQRKFNDRTIVFVRTKLDCHRLCMLLNLLDIKAAELHGGLTQTQVNRNFFKFKILINY